MEKINWRKFNIGQKQFQVTGIASTEKRKRLIGEAIGLIQKDPSIVLRKERLGYKNYEAFGDQRCDCEYGYGPRHGYIVFSIGRSTDYNEKENHEEKIYFLKCFRDAPGLGKDGDKELNIQEVFQEMRSLELQSGELQEFLDVIEVDVDETGIVKN